MACKNPRCDSGNYLCGKCRRQFPDAARALDARMKEARRSTNRQPNTFQKKRPDGTTLYGPEGMDKRPGNKHGHRGDNFDRSPHSTIGSAAIDDAHTYDEHRDDRTHRW
ncbi:hypothetical protein NONI108955_22700 [Nocardia ninae]|uniref:Uncharacterized protein n=1 Tax=Nocardia ninae NBRC 108245 TaxID=1210091 RepID=A0A511MFB2_9NOCA|nr:hypothetical protein [Nocardia ninae]GEM38546.1 hypothetical protein NN4_30650 [Nocardia ninae NBRC 108245]